MGSYLELNNITQLSYKILSEIPLCDRCLGRVFSILSTSLTNEERGKSIKITLAMEIDSLIRERRVKDLSEVLPVLKNMGTIGETVLRKYGVNEPVNYACWLCKGRLSYYESELYQGVKKLVTEKSTRIALGVRLSRELSASENTLISKYKLTYYESIKNEIKRETGKRLKQEGFIIDLNTPELFIIYDVEANVTYLEWSKERVFGTYSRLVRGIPLETWEEKEDMRTLTKAKFYVPFSEPKDVRIFCEYPIFLEKLPENAIEGFQIRVIKKIPRRNRILLSSTPKSRKYRVTLYTKRQISGIKITDNVYDVFIEARDYKDLLLKIKNALSDAEIISIDAISLDQKTQEMIKRNE
ncbi:pseudouridylate synthase [Sulfolobales archaeon HS-7]|nr:pseudouridylate synthase [Sulfolobales archaeon HS-7]